MRRHLVPSLLAGMLVACQGDTGFTAGTGNTDDLQGTGDLEMIPAGELVWTDLVPGCTVSQYVRLDSVGDENLVVNRIDVTVSGGGTFSMDTIQDVTVPIGEAYEFTVQARLADLVEAEGELRIASNDVDSVDLRVPLRAVPVEGLDTGDTGDPCD